MILVDLVPIMPLLHERHVYDDVMKLITGQRIPGRRATDIVYVGKTKGVPAQAATIIKAATPTGYVPRPLITYTVRDRRRKTPTDLTPSEQDVYRVVSKAAKPANVKEVAAWSKHPLEATRVVLNRLVKAKVLVRRESIAA